MDHLENAFATVNDSGFNPEEHEPNKLHELLAGGAAFAAMKQYENRRAAEGYHDHARARELLAGLAGAEIDKMIETRGLDAVDAERAKHAAYQQASQMYDSAYGQSGEGAAQRGSYGGGAGYARGEGYGQPEAIGYGQREGYEARPEGGYEQRGGYDQGYGQREQGYGQREGYGGGY